MEIKRTFTRTMYVNLALLMFVRMWSFYFAIGLVCALFVLGIISDFPLVVAFIFLIFTIFVYALAILRAVFSSKNRNMFLKERYIFKDKNITVITPLSKETVKWDAFVEWKRIGGYYLLYLSRAFFWVIPRSAIPVRKVLAFESMLGDKIKTKKKLSKK